MRFNIEVQSCENGYLVLEPTDNGRYFASTKWVAANEQELGELVEKLAKESKVPKTKVETP